jgi:acyl-CoA synthetase (NDP forming)
MSLKDMLKHAARDLTKEARLSYDHNIPMTVSAFFDREDYYTEAYEDNGVPVYDSPEKAARAMSTLVAYKKILDRNPSSSILMPQPDNTAAQMIKDAQRKKQKALDEYAAKKFLSCYGIPVPDEEIAFDVREAVNASRKIGFPVAVKACDPEILHKTEQGLVYLNIASEEGVARSYQNIQKAVGHRVPVLVSQMISGKREFLAGITHDPQFGHCVAFGLGGILTEAVNDVTYRLAPLSIRDAKEMISDIKTAKLLGSFRGMPEVDLQALANFLVRLSSIPLIHPEILEIDMNPLIISGAMPVAVDALMVLG